MPEMSASALRGAFVEAVLTDSAFREAVAKDGAAAVEARFGRQPFSIRIENERPNELLVLVPQRTEQLAQALDRAVDDIGDRGPTRGQFQAVLVQRAWNEAGFAARLREDAAAAVGSVLKEYGDYGVPEGTPVRLLEEQAGECVLVVPHAFSDRELSDEELEAVAGGEGVVIAATVVGGVIVTAGGIVGAVAGSIVKEWVCS